MPIEIHGKQYVTVAERVAKFREDLPIATGWGIVTEIISQGSDAIVMRAQIHDPEGHVVACGHAEEKFGTTQINQTSAVENCETSAIGRALAACGYGGTEYASANEVQNAIGQQVRQFPKVPSESAKQRERVSNAPKQLPPPEEREEWHVYEVHYGTNGPGGKKTREVYGITDPTRGVPLGRLSDNSLQWYQNNYQPDTEYDNPQDKHLRAMLDASMGKKVEKIETVEEPETEDIPF